MNSSSSFELVGFDADDTLWHSEIHFEQAHAEFERIVGAYVDLADAGLHQRLLDTERRNIKLFGYGAKGMCLSMIETSIALLNFWQSSDGANDPLIVIETKRLTQAYLAVYLDEA